MATATGLGSLALLGGCKGGSVGASADVQSGSPLSTKPVDNTAEVQRWVAAVGQPVRVSNAVVGTTGRIKLVETSAPREVPVGVRQQSFIVHFDLDPTSIPLTEGVYAITSPIPGLAKLFMSVSSGVSAQAVFG